MFIAMQVPEVTGARARALHTAGMATPEELAHASEDQIAKALAVGLPRAMRAGTSKALAVGVTGNEATNALSRRTARLVLAGASPCMALQHYALVDCPPVVL